MEKKTHIVAFMSSHVKLRTEASKFYLSEKEGKAEEARNKYCNQKRKC